MRWRRESDGGNTDQPGRDNLRGSAEKADHEKLNDERGIKPLPVNRSRDEAGSGRSIPGGLKGIFLYSTPPNQFGKIELETMTGRESGTYLDGMDVKLSYQRDCCSEGSK